MFSLGNRPIARYKPDTFLVKMYMLRSARLLPVVTW